MTPVLVFDIETIPDIDGLRRLHETPSSVSDEALLAQVQAERREKTGSDFLPLYLQKIVAIACVFCDAQGFRVKSLGQLDSNEAHLVQQFFKIIDYYTPQLVSWNGSGFDLPVLHYRSLLHGVASPRYWDNGDDNRDFKFNNYLSRYHTRHLDLMDVLAAYNGRANAPLDQLAKLCGFPGKLGMDGSQVYDAWQAGLGDEIRNYCETDVVNTYLLYCRYRLLRGELDANAYEQALMQVRQALQALQQPHWEEYLSLWPQ